MEENKNNDRTQIFSSKEIEEIKAASSKADTKILTHEEVIEIRKASEETSKQINEKKED